MSGLWTMESSVGITFARVSFGFFPVTLSIVQLGCSWNLFPRYTIAPVGGSQVLGVRWNDDDWWRARVHTTRSDVRFYVRCSRVGETGVWAERYNISSVFWRGYVDTCSRSFF